MPYRCRDCRKYFSVRTGTAIEASNLSMRKWAYAIYLWLTSLKGVSAMKLQRDLRVSYPTAWFVAHRLRESFVSQAALFSGPVEVDEMYMGEKRTPGYAIANLKVSYTYAQQHLAHQFSVSVFNIGDRLYRNHSSFIKDFAPGIGRGVRFTYMARFF